MSDSTVTPIAALARERIAAPQHAQRIEARRLRFREHASSNTRRPGFSSRLNLLCSLAGERDLGAGRLEDVTALDTGWSSDVVRGWLTRDEIPPQPELQSLVAFLTSQLAGNGLALHWEAYLLYGNELVGAPPQHLQAIDDRALAQLAAETLSRITREERIDADRYNADSALARTAQALKDLNIGANGANLQDGHLRIIALRVFAGTID